MTVGLPLTASFSVPASTSNLGAGFDTLGLAVNRYLTIRHIARTTAPGLSCRYLGVTPPGENYITAGFRQGLKGSSIEGGLEIEVESSIPARAGLGSSAAAYVAGLRLASLLTPRPLQALLDAATLLEGHPDNASASLLGGFTVSAVDDGGVTSRAFSWPAAFKLVVGLPRLELATSEARAVLPTQVPVADAVYNVQRASSLVAAVLSADPEMLRASLGDRLHQPARAALVPGLSKILALRHPRLLGAFLSGAGPSVIAVCLEETSAVEAMLREVYLSLGVPALVEPIDAVAPLQHAGETAEPRS